MLHSPSLPHLDAGIPRGVALHTDGATVSVWAPHANEVALHVATGAACGDHPLTRIDDEHGVWALDVPGLRAGDRYGFRLDGGDPIPDPTSRAQPDGVNGLSQVVDPTAFAWDDDHWPGLPLADFLIYELH